MVVVKLAGLGDRGRAMLEDIGIMNGALLPPKKLASHEKSTLNDPGHAKCHFDSQPDLHHGSDGR